MNLNGAIRMPNPQTKIFVAPGAGRKSPLPIPGERISVPAEGRLVTQSFAVQRLLRCGDLVAATAKTETNAKTGKMEG